MAVDFALTDGFDLVIKNGDFAVGESAASEAQLIILSAKGEWKQWPLVGVDLRKYLASPQGPREQASFIADIRVQLEADGKKDVAFTTNGNGNFSLTLK